MVPIDNLQGCNPEFADELLTPEQAEEEIGLKVATLAKLRCHGGGPEYYKMGRLVKYSRRTCREWREKRRAINTSDADRRLPRRLADPMPPGDNRIE